VNLRRAPHGGHGAGGDSDDDESRADEDGDDLIAQLQDCDGAPL
jgi:hypothetical protein